MLRCRKAAVKNDSLQGPVHIREKSPPITKRPLKRHSTRMITSLELYSLLCMTSKISLALVLWMIKAFFWKSLILSRSSGGMDWNSRGLSLPLCLVPLFKIAGIAEPVSSASNMLVFVMTLGVFLQYASKKDLKYHWERSKNDYGGIVESKMDWSYIEGRIE